MKTQHDDLIESEDALKKIIADLDEEMRKQFTEKFADIQKQFDKVFRELFGGGKTYWKPALQSMRSRRERNLAT